MVRSLSSSDAYDGECSSSVNGVVDGTVVPVAVILLAVCLLVAAEAEEAMIRRGAKANANEADRILSIQQLLVENDMIQYSIQIVLEVDIMV